MFHSYICWKLTVLKEAFSGLYWKNKLKLETGKSEVLNVFFASAKGGKGRPSAYKVPLAPVLKGRVQGKDLPAVDEGWVKDHFRELEPCKSLGWPAYIQGCWELASVLSRQLYHFKKLCTSEEISNEWRNANIAPVF